MHSSMRLPVDQGTIPEVRLLADEMEMDTARLGPA